MKEMIRNNKENFLQLKDPSLQRAHHVPSTINGQDQRQRKLAWNSEPEARVQRLKTSWKKKRRRTPLTKAGMNFLRANLNVRTAQDKVFTILKEHDFLKENGKFYTQLNYPQGIRCFRVCEDSECLPSTHFLLGRP